MLGGLGVGSLREQGERRAARSAPRGRRRSASRRPGPPARRRFPRRRPCPRVMPGTEEPDQLEAARSCLAKTPPKRNANPSAIPTIMRATKASSKPGLAAITTLPADAAQHADPQPAENREALRDPRPRVPSGGDPGAEDRAREEADLAQAGVELGRDLRHDRAHVARVPRRTEADQEDRGPGAAHRVSPASGSARARRAAPAARPPARRRRCATGRASRGRGA